MSDKIGTVAFESGHDEVFIGRTMTQGRSYSEAVAAQIDQEVQRLVADAYDRCERILNDNRNKLEAVASYLLEHETCLLYTSGEEWAAIAAVSGAPAPAGVRPRALFWLCQKESAPRPVEEKRRLARSGTMALRAFLTQTGGLLFTAR